MGEVPQPRRDARKGFATLAARIVPFAEMAMEVTGPCQWLRRNALN
jgi:hypothetical protein